MFLTFSLLFSLVFQKHSITIPWVNGECRYSCSELTAAHKFHKFANALAVVWVCIRTAQGEWRGGGRANCKKQTVGVWRHASHRGWTQWHCNTCKKQLKNNSNNNAIKWSSSGIDASLNVQLKRRMCCFSSSHEGGEAAFLAKHRPRTNPDKLPEGTSLYLGCCIGSLSFLICNRKLPN